MRLTDERIDAHLDCVLRASGSALRHYSMQKSLDDMRSAMRAIEAEVLRLNGLSGDGKKPVAWVEPYALKELLSDKCSGITCGVYSERYGRTTPLYATPPQQQQSAPAGLPPRILDLLLELADRQGTDAYGPWQDGNGEPLQDDADAALAWLAAHGITAPKPQDKS